jgi:hypothetical protein
MKKVRVVMFPVQGNLPLTFSSFYLPETNTTRTYTHTTVSALDLTETLSVLTLNVFPGSPLPYLWNGTTKLAHSKRLKLQVSRMLLLFLVSTL